MDVSVPDDAPMPAEQVGRIFFVFEDAKAAAECARRALTLYRYWC
jgi:hypothetical protein